MFLINWMKIYNDEWCPFKGYMTKTLAKACNGELINKILPIRSNSKPF